MSDNSGLSLVSSPGDNYFQAIEKALEGATNVTLITAFATAAGIDRLLGPLRKVLSAPTGQARLILAVDRQHFNAEPLFRALLDAHREFAPRLSIGLVPQTLGLLHAKALMADSARGTTLVVGSANLTEGAFARNLELGVVIQSPSTELVRAFRAFERRLEARTLDDSSAPQFLKQLGLLSTPRPRMPQAPRNNEQSWQDLVSMIHGQAKLPPLPTDPVCVVSEWIAMGFLVGQGRRSGEVLVVRVPLESLERLELVSTTRRRSLGGGARESKTVSYQIDLLPPLESDAVRKEIRRTARVLSRLSLNLPCFGYWMPEPYWNVFESIQEQLVESPGLGTYRLLDAAKTQRDRLLNRAGLEEDLSRILDSMIRDDLVEVEKKDSIHAYLLPELRRRIQSRTPELIADAVQFRTARQRWSPFESTELPYRQAMVDVVQAVFSSTMKNGEWPKRFHSLVAKELAISLSDKLLAAGRDIDGAMAQQMLEQSSEWEREDISMSAVVEQFRAIISLEHEFTAPERDEIFSNLDEEKDANDAS